MRIFTGLVLIVAAVAVCLMLGESISYAWDNRMRGYSLLYCLLFVIPFMWLIEGFKRLTKPASPDSQKTDLLFFIAAFFHPWLFSSASRLKRKSPKLIDLLGPVFYLGLVAWAWLNGSTLIYIGLVFLFEQLVGMFYEPE